MPDTPAERTPTGISLTWPDRDGPDRDGPDRDGPDRDGPDESVVAVFDPVAGGRLATLTVGHQSLLADRPSGADGIGWGAYVMAPWAGRVRGGRFSFDGATHQLERNHSDHRPGVPSDELQHAIHGTVTDQTWTVDTNGPASASLTCRLDGAAAWPFGGSVTSTVFLEARRLSWTVAVTSGRDERFPAIVGWHPWFTKPDRLSFSPDAMYERDAAGLPTGRIVEPSSGPWDDCFVATGPVQMHYAREVAPVVTVASDCDHWVVYDEPADATCVEPQSGPPDAFNLRDFQAHVVDHTTPLRRTMSISW